MESMSRAPMGMPKADTAFSRKAEIYDTTITWRFVNKLMTKKYGTETMPKTAENVAEDFSISREDQDAFALRSQQRAAADFEAGIFLEEIITVTIPKRRGDAIVISEDEHPRTETTLEKLAKLGTNFRVGGTVTAGNVSGINDGACAFVLASEDAGQ